jgi:hypothetical protein
VKRDFCEWQIIWRKSAPFDLGLASIPTAWVHTAGAGPYSRTHPFDTVELLGAAGHAARYFMDMIMLMK